MPQPINPFEILARYHPPTAGSHEILVVHSVLVARLAHEIARAHLERHAAAELDLPFILEAALLHDIGIGECDAPGIGCHGREEYIRHGVIGREILEREGLPRHALVCERHTGSGIRREEVREQGLPLPDRDYLPESAEEKIICIADKFYSKTPSRLWEKQPLAKIDVKIARWGSGPRERWEALKREFLGEGIADCGLRIAD